jgi:hypothetical protein
MLWNDMAFEQKDVKKRKLCLKVSIDMLKQSPSLSGYAWRKGIIIYECTSHSSNIKNLKIICNP